jgi:hypothetical protein
MSTLVRALTSTGLEQFRAYLAQIRGGANVEPLWSLLEDPAATEELSRDVSVEPRWFSSRWSVGEYLNAQLAALPPREVEGNRGLWAWLSLYYFDQVCPPRPVRKPGQDYRHVPDFSFRHRYRHLLYGPYAVYRRHRGHAILLLAGPLRNEQTIYHEITSRLDLIASQGVIEALNALYLDRKKGTPKPGAQAGAQRAGAVRRFVQVLQQLDVTYDIYGISGKEILNLLPPEFDVWRGGPGVLRLE